MVCLMFLRRLKYTQPNFKMKYKTIGLLCGMYIFILTFILVQTLLTKDILCTVSSASVDLLDYIYFCNSGLQHDPNSAGASKVLLDCNVAKRSMFGISFPHYSSKHILRRAVVLGHQLNVHFNI